MNRLAQETSPYLLQHAHNPVDWYPWGQEAFEAAKKRDVPILLSVGYSSCHWCHVMAHESFEDPNIARGMNKFFVNVKVDREERPDVDAIYMEVLQLMTGNGGWPMTVFLLPDQRPFYAGTYFPKVQMGSLPSFADVLNWISQLWVQDRSKIISQANSLSQALQDHSRLVSNIAPQSNIKVDSSIAKAISEFKKSFDPNWGGFGGPPKFPQPSRLDFIIRSYYHSKDQDLLKIFSTTLDAMASGGIYDHLGGGFSRYSVDKKWTIPHFEKMLYDQAGLVRNYIYGWQLTKNKAWLQVAEETINYVLSELKIKSNKNDHFGLACAQDADSEGQEGLFYSWSWQELKNLIPEELFQIAQDWYGFSKKGNFEGKNILLRSTRGDLIRPVEIEKVKNILLEARSKRIAPGLDNKILTELNAMFCSSLAEAAAANSNTNWQQAALSIGEFIFENLFDKKTRLMRSWQDGVVRHLGYCSDYAWTIDAFTRLSEMSGQKKWLERSVLIAEQLIDLFWDETENAFFFTGKDAPELLIRTKEIFDSATPSSNSVAAVALWRLGALTGIEEFKIISQKIAKWASSIIEQAPGTVPYLLWALEMIYQDTTEVVIAGDRLDLVNVVHHNFLPEVVLAWGEKTSSPLWDERLDQFGYVCHNYSCSLPAKTPQQLSEQLHII